MNMPTMESVSRFKAAMDSDRGALGPFMICTDPAMVEAAGRAGYDFVLLDMEHGTTTFQTLPNLIRAANVSGVCPVVRVPRGTDIWIDQALDVGAGAVMIPQIDTAEQARAAVSAAKFSPVGTRGTCRFVRSAGFGDVPGSEYFSKAQDTAVILQAEGKKAIENLDEILDVPGIDVVFVGPYDLSSSLGHVGEIDHPEVVAAIKEIIANKPMLIYILSYFFYIDGVHTVISMATTYGTNLGLDSTGMMLALLLVQILGLPFCLLYIKCSEKFGARTMVGFGICVYMFICIFAFFMNSLWQFWVLAVLCATSQGGIQALSRSMYGKLIPDKDRSGEFFGFFDIFGKFSSIMGPALVGVVSSVVANGMLGAQGLTAQTATAEQIDAINAQSSHYGILSIIIIIIVGAVLYFGFLPKAEHAKQ